MTITSKTITIAFVVSSLLAATSWMMANKQSTLAPTPAISPTDQSVSNESKEQSEGNVTVIVTPLKLIRGETPVFQLTFETHSVDLSFDVSAITTLMDDTGILYGVPVWNGSPPGGHHRKGTLSFSQPLAPSIQQVTITLFNIADVPKRTFTWRVKSL